MNADYRERFWGSAWSAARGSVVLAVGVVMIAGCGSAADSSKQRDSAARSPQQPAEKVSVGELSEEMLGQRVAVQGEVIQQCPAIGCWMIVKDDSGELFIDLKPASLELSESRRGEQAQVTGRVSKQGARMSLEAASVKFTEAEQQDGPQDQEPQ